MHQIGLGCCRPFTRLRCLFLGHVLRLVTRSADCRMAKKRRASINRSTWYVCTQGSSSLSSSHYYQLNWYCSPIPGDITPVTM